MYQFNLEPLLKHRCYQEEILRKELAALKIRMEAEKDTLRALRQKKHKTLLVLQQKQSDGLRTSEIKLYNDFVDQLSKGIEVQWQKVMDVNLTAQFI